MLQKLHRSHHGSSQRLRIGRRSASLIIIVPRATNLAQSSNSILSQWAAKRGLALDKVQVDESSTMQAQLIASKDIAAGEQVLTVPESSFITSSSASKHPLISSILTSNKDQPLDAWLLVALLLIIERYSPPGSIASQQGGDLSAYAQSLPDPKALPSLTFPLFWGDELLDELQGTQVSFIRSSNPSLLFFI